MSSFLGLRYRQRTILVRLFYVLAASTIVLRAGPGRVPSSLALRPTENLPRVPFGVKRVSSAVSLNPPTSGLRRPACRYDLRSALGRLSTGIFSWSSTPRILSVGGSQVASRRKIFLGDCFGDRSNRFSTLGLEGILSRRCCDVRVQLGDEAGWLGWRGWPRVRDFDVKTMDLSSP